MSKPMFEIDKAALGRLIAVFDGRLIPLPPKAARAMYTVGELWMTISKGRTPVRHGALRASGHVEQPTLEGRGGWAVRMVFGGPSVSYAVHVHENLRAKHPVGQSKYLESVVAERRASLSTSIAALLASE